MRLYYAQNKEDLFIKAFFPDITNGFYIDVGANDPILDSVTKLLYDEGWSGINVEPIQGLADALRRERPRDTILQIGISNKAGKLTFTEYPEGNGLSTFNDSMRDYYKQGDHPFPTSNVKEYTVPVKTLNDVIKEAKPAHIHVLKIDVEGYEYEVIEGNDWHVNRPELICIEANHINHDWRPVLEKNKYHLVFFDGVNNYYLAEESLSRKDNFDYPDTVFAGNPVYYPAYLEISKPLESQLKALSQKVQDQEENIALLHRQQRDVRFLAKRLAIEVQLRLNKRAKGNTQRSGLTYAHDESIQAKLAEPKQKSDSLISFIHERDSVNVQSHKQSVIAALKPIPWKVAAAVFSTMIIVAKKGVRFVR